MLLILPILPSDVWEGEKCKLIRIQRGDRCRVVRSVVEDNAGPKPQHVYTSQEFKP